jgi:hypothetical protein
MSKVCTLDADCTATQLSRMRVGIDTSDRKRFWSLNIVLRLKRSLLPTTSALATNWEPALPGV